MLDALQVDAANLGRGAALLDQLLRLLQDGDAARLVLQALHVLVALRVARLPSAPISVRWSVSQCYLTQ
jgi:hypothetical protein